MDLVIVGGGLSGLGAAAAAGEAGLRALLVDERLGPGGSADGEPGASYDDAAPWLLPPLSAAPEVRDRVAELTLGARATGVELQFDALAWGLFREGAGFRVAYTRGGRTTSVRSRQVVLATGTYVAPHPFAGAALPGVLVPVQAHMRLRQGAFRPGQRAVIYGDNPVAAATARMLAGQGVAITAWLRDPGDDPAPSPRPVPVRGGIEVLGDGRVEFVRYAGPAGAQEVPADWVLLAAPLAYSYELAAQVGCEMAWTGYRRGFVPVFDSHLQTTVPGLSVAGSLAGTRTPGDRVASGRAAVSRGDGAAAGAANLPWAFGHTGLREVRPDEPPTGSFYPTLTDLAADHMICPCFQHMLGELQTAIHLGCRTIDDAKRTSGVGMGRCQGRICSRSVVHLLQELGGVSPSSLRPLRARAPVRQLPLHAMYEGEVANG